jgi:uncharacterized protein (TIGR02118 family)
VIKTLALLARRPDLTREAFRKHYENRHVALALPHVPQLRRYVRNHVLEVPWGPEPPFDCLTEFWYPDRAALEQVLAHLQSPAAAELLEDELRFMDKARNAFFAATEREPQASVGAAGAPVYKLAVLVRHALGSGALAGLAELLPGRSRCFYNEALDAPDAAPPYRGVAFAQGSAPPPAGALAAWAERFQPALVLRVLECETPLPAASPR